MVSISLLASFVAVATLVPVSSWASCSPPRGISDFNLTEYTRASWFVQKQQLNGYQKEDQLYCVVATYELNKSQTVPGFDGAVVQVFNQANEGGVNQKTQNDGTVLCARAPNANNTGPEGSQLLVAPCFLPNALAGDYWVMALGTSDEATTTSGTSVPYEWAVIIAGMPSVDAPCGGDGPNKDLGCCTTPEEGINGAGLWFLTRDRVATEATIAAMTKATVGQGIAVSKLKDVTQEGCDYDGYFLKH